MYWCSLVSDGMPDTENILQNKTEIASALSGIIIIKIYIKLIYKIVLYSYKL